MKRILTHNIYRSAEHYPDRLAFKQMSNQISYQDLVLQSNQLAHFLTDNNVKKGDRVAIFMNRSFESGVAVYGILSSGAAYVPIDTNLPIERIQEILDDCNIQVLITNTGFSRKVEELLTLPTPLKIVIGSKVGESSMVSYVSQNDVSTYPTHAPKVSLSESDLAYIIYTSGTTGKPKGIVHTHYSGYSYAKLSAELYGVQHTDILGNHSHLHFDISTMGYLTMPYAGGCTVIVPEAYTLFPASLCTLLEEEQLTIWYSVPLALIQMMQSGVLGKKSLGKLRWILFGGESFAKHHILNLFDYFPDATYSNVYGPAEVNQCTFYNFKRDDKIPESIPLGAVWPETQFIIDKDTATDEQTGELLVASSTQMKEYWGKPDLTNSKMVIAENNKENASRFYRTGDIVKQNEGGTLFFIGRKDRQVKIRGYRVELNEIETKLRKYPMVNDVAVYTKELEDTIVIHAIVVTNNEVENTQNIKEFLGTLLPKYAIPEKIEIAPTIPRTGAGKVDYKQIAK